MNNRLIRYREVSLLTGLKHSSIYSKMSFNPKRPNDHDPDFPKTVNLGGRSVAWIEQEILDWVQARINASRGTAQGGGYANHAPQK